MAESPTPMTSTSTTTEGKYAELKEELLQRHKKELEELEDRFRRENQTVIIRASHLSERPAGSFVLEIVFSIGPTRREIDKVNHAVDKALKASLAEIGYKLRWEEPKSWE